MKPFTPLAVDIIKGARLPNAERDKVVAAARSIAERRGDAWVIAPVARAALDGMTDADEFDINRYALTEDKVHKGKGKAA